MNRSRAAVMCLGIAMISAGSKAGAQTVQDRFPVRFIDRPVVLRGGMLQLNAEGSYVQRRAETHSNLDAPSRWVSAVASVAYGISDTITLGGVPSPVRVWPTAYLDSPSVFLSWGARGGAWSYGVTAQVEFPVADDAHLRLVGRVPLWLRLSRGIQLRAQAEVGVPLSSNAGVSFGVPVQAVFQADSPAYFTVGVRPHWERLESSMLLGANLTAGYTLRSRLGPVADLEFSAALPRLLRTDGAPVDLSSFSAGLVCRFFFYQ